MRRLRLIVVVSLAILFAQIQCAAACAGDLVKPEPMPPCHRHHGGPHDSAPGSCMHHVIASPAMLPHGVHILPDLAVIGLPAVALVSQARSGLAQESRANHSPPGCEAPLSVLRI